VRRSERSVGPEFQDNDAPHNLHFEDVYNDWIGIFRFQIGGKEEDRPKATVQPHAGWLKVTIECSLQGGQR
jgi:hypothetical protein